MVRMRAYSNKPLLFLVTLRDTSTSLGDSFHLLHRFSLLQNQTRKFQGNYLLPTDRHQLPHTTVLIAHNTNQSDTGHPEEFHYHYSRYYWDNYLLPVERQGWHHSTVQVFGYNTNRYNIEHKGQQTFLIHLAR